MDETTDPRDLGGNIAGPGGPHDRGAVVLDTRRAVLLDYTTVAQLDAPGSFQAGLLLEGRINHSDDRAKVLFLVNEDGVGAILSELIGLLGRAGQAHPETIENALERLQNLRDEGNLAP